MADNSYKISKSLNLSPQASTPVNPVNGDVYFDSNVGSYAYYNRGAWSYLDSVGNIATTANMTSAQFTPAVVRHSMIRLTGDFNDPLVHGLSASYSGKRIVIYNNTNSTLTIKHDSVTEIVSNNRINTPISEDMTVISGEVAQLIYDGDNQRWLLVSVGSGAGAYSRATTTTPGIIRASHDVPDPVAVVLDVNNNIAAFGLTRGGATPGPLNIGLGANDASVVISKSGATTTVNGTLLTNTIRPIGIQDGLTIGHRTYDAAINRDVKLYAGDAANRDSIYAASIKFFNAGNVDIWGDGYITAWMRTTSLFEEPVALMDTTGTLSLSKVKAFENDLDVEATNLKITADTQITGTLSSTGSLSTPYINVGTFTTVASDSVQSHRFVPTSTASILADGESHTLVRSNVVRAWGAVTAHGVFDNSYGRHNVLAVHRINTGWYEIKLADEALAGNSQSSLSVVVTPTLPPGGQIQRGSTAVGLYRQTIIRNYGRTLRMNGTHIGVWTWNYNGALDLGFSFVVLGRGPT